MTGKPEPTRMVKPPRTRRISSLDRITWRLVAFSLLNFAGVTLAIALLSPGDVRSTSAANAARFALRHAADDSWKPMLLALDEVRSSQERSVYDRLFFEEKIKFQYPPSSLLAIDLLRQIRGRNPAVALLNNISWLFVLALGVIVPTIYLSALKEFNPGVWHRFTRRDVIVQAAVVCLMTLTFYPITRGYALGQIQTWLTCLFAGAVLAWLRGREILSGVLIGLIITVKPQLAVLLLWGAIQRRGRFVAGAAATAAALLGLSLWRYGPENHTGYVSVLSYLAAHGESFFANQSVNGLLARLLHVGNNVEWDARNFPPFHPVVYYGTALSSCLLIGLALVGNRRRDREGTLLRFCLAGLLSTMASPIAWEHHYGILAPVFAVAAASAWKAGGPIGWIAASYVLCSNSLAFTNRAADTSWNFVQSYLLAGAGALVFVLFVQVKPAKATAPTMTRVAPQGTKCY